MEINVYFLKPPSFHHSSAKCPNLRYPHSTLFPQTAFKEQDSRPQSGPNAESFQKGFPALQTDIQEEIAAY